MLLKHFDYPGSDVAAGTVCINSGWGSVSHTSAPSVR